MFIIIFLPRAMPWARSFCPFRACWEQPDYFTVIWKSYFTVIWKQPCFTSYLI